MANNIGLFFNTSKNTRPFAEVLAQVQEYLASKYSTLITDNPEEQRQQITAYIAKYLNDYSLGVEGMDHEALIDKLYTEMAEFSFLTPYLFASDVEEININSWKDTKITYADGSYVPDENGHILRDTVLVFRNDRCARNREVQWMPENRDDGEPFREGPDHGRLCKGADPFPDADTTV